jgi:hypothetical protein
MLAIGLAAAPAGAQQVTFRISSTVGYVDDPLGTLDDRIGSGDSLTTWYSFDPDTSPVVLLGTAYYIGAVTCLRMEVEGLAFENEYPAGSEDTQIVVVDRQDPGASDVYRVLVGDESAEIRAFLLGLSSSGPTTALDGGVLPSIPLDLGSFPTRSLAVELASAEGASFGATIDAIALADGPPPCGGAQQSIPVPGTNEPPRIDGSLDAGEWTGAAIRPLEGGQMRLLHDDVRLYVLLNMREDGTDDPAYTGGFDQFWLAFDVDEDQVVTPNVDRRYRQQEQTGNLRYETYCDGCPFGFNDAFPSTFSARGEGFGCFFADGSATHFPLSCDAHRVWEIAIDLEEIGARADRSARMGYLVQGGSGVLEVFPPALTDPAGFLTLELLGETASGGAGEPPVETGLEITQAIQDDGNGLDLVARKPTVARAFLTTTSSTPATAIVSLSASRDGVDLPGSPLVRFATAREVPDSSADTRRAAAGNSVNWRLPENWTVGDVGFATAMRRPWVLTAGGSSPQLISFRETVTPTYWVVPVNLGTAESPVLPDDDFLESMEESTLELYPVETIDFVRRPPLVVGSTDASALIESLNELHAAALLAWTLGLVFTGESPFDLPDQIFGTTSMGLCSNPPSCSKTGGGLSDPVWAEGNGYVSWGAPSATSQRFVLAHEVNHNLDRNPAGGWGNHAGGCRADTGPTWPYANSNIQEWGFQASLATDAPGPDLVVPDTAPDLMSYCQQGPGGPVKWISPYRWQALLGEIFAAPVAVARAATAAAPPVADAYYVRGRVHEDGSGELDPILAQPGLPDGFAGSGSHAIEVRSCAGGLVAERRFTPSFVTADGDPRPIFSFFYQLPADLDVCAVRLLGGEVVLDEWVRTPAAPTVSIVSPGPGELWTGTHLAQWQAQDGDGDDLTFTLLFSPDNGATWRPIASGLAGTSAEVDSRQLEATSQARLRVIATDGFHTVHADSAQPFSVSEAPPTVSIQPSPAASLFAAGTLVEFRGLARGKDGTAVPGTDYVWLLDDEPIGTGALLTLRIPDERKTLALEAAEGDGPTGEAILPIPEPDGALAVVAAMAALACARRARGSRSGSKPE